MTRIAISNQRPASSTSRLPAALLFAAVLSCLSAQTYAQESARSSRSSELVSARQVAAGLEKDFWACDYAATTHGVGLQEGAMCGVVYEDLKRSKFGGDFQAMLSWWRQNKAAEHLALAAVSRTVAAPRADQVTSR
jgi:hypothetical protein